MSNVVVVGTNGNSSGHAAVWEAASLAAAWSARLVIVAAFHPVSRVRLDAESRDVPADLAWRVNPHEDVDALLTAARAGAVAAGAPRIRTIAVEGAPARAIAGVANTWDADVVLIGRSRSDARSRRLARSLTRRCHCDVRIPGDWPAAPTCSPVTAFRASLA